MEIIIAPFQSENYQKSIALRYKILRKPLGMVFTQEQLAEEYNQFHFVAKKEELIIGVIVMQILPQKVAKMRQVAIDEDFQKMGVGTKMITHIEEWCKSKGLCKITLHAREKAIPFYQKLNYHIVGEPFFEIGILHSIMEKKIG